MSKKTRLTAIKKVPRAIQKQCRTCGLHDNANHLLRCTVYDGAVMAFWMPGIFRAKCLMHYTKDTFLEKIKTYSLCPHFISDICCGIDADIEPQEECTTCKRLND